MVNGTAEVKITVGNSIRRTRRGQADQKPPTSIQRQERGSSSKGLAVKPGCKGQRRLVRYQPLASDTWHASGSASLITVHEQVVFNDNKNKIRAFTYKASRDPFSPLVYLMGGHYRAHFWEARGTLLLVPQPTQQVHSAGPLWLWFICPLVPRLHRCPPQL